jgi:hypothetical protein
LLLKYFTSMKELSTTQDVIDVLYKFQLFCRSVVLVLYSTRQQSIKVAGVLRMVRRWAQTLVTRIHLTTIKV